MRKSKWICGPLYTGLRIVKTHCSSSGLRHGGGARRQPSANLGESAEFAKRAPSEALPIFTNMLFRS